MSLSDQQKNELNDFMATLKATSDDNHHGVMDVRAMIYDTLINLRVPHEADRIIDYLYHKLIGDRVSLRSTFLRDTFKEDNSEDPQVGRVVETALRALHPDLSWVKVGSSGYVIIAHNQVLAVYVCFNWGVITNHFVKTPYSTMMDILKTMVFSIYGEVSTFSVQRIKYDKRNGIFETVSETITPDSLDIPHDMMYPGKPTPAALLKRFQTARGKVILLKGEGGTGKSNYIYQMMAATNWKNIYTVDNEDVFTRDEFIDFVREVIPDGSSLIIEDGDRLLGKRTDGNQRMAALLNAVSGIASKKIYIYITVNLQTLSSVDEALLRGGRLFKFMEFNKLTLDEARVLRRYLGGDPWDLTAKEGYTVGDVINYDEMYGEEGDIELLPPASDFGFNKS